MTPLARLAWRITAVLAAPWGWLLDYERRTHDWSLYLDDETDTP